VLCYSQRSGANKQTENFFSPGEDSDNEDDAAVKTAEQMVESTTIPTRLPNPLSGSIETAADDDDERRTSVFTNYFHKAEEAKLAVLEHHVKLTTEELKTKNEQAKRPNKKKVCVSFQRGRCRFGAKCRFAHSIASEATDTGTDVPAEVSSITPKFGLLPSAHLMPLNIEPDEDEDAFGTQKKRKHRSGVTDSLLPPKRAMTSLEQQRKEERPWTVARQ